MDAVFHAGRLLTLAQYIAREHNDNIYSFEKA